MTPVLVTEGEDFWILGVFYVAVVQAVILYASETWVTSLHVGKELGGFHHRLVCRLTGRKLSS